MKQPRNKILYLFSTVMKISYNIEKNYYDNIHFAWCSPELDMLGQPGTSNPLSIAKRYLKAAHTGDSHEEFYEAKFAKMLAIAQARKNNNKITSYQFDCICKKIAAASYADVVPILLIIDWNKVKKRVHKETVCRASLYSIEYIIDDLREDEFRAIDIEAIVNEQLNNPIDLIIGDNK